MSFETFLLSVLRGPDRAHLLHEKLKHWYENSVRATSDELDQLLILRRRPRRGERDELRRRRRRATLRELFQFDSVSAVVIDDREHRSVGILEQRALLSAGHRRKKRRELDATNHLTELPGAVSDRGCLSKTSSEVHLFERSIVCGMVTKQKRRKARQRQESPRNLATFFDSRFLRVVFLHFRFVNSEILR